MLSYLLTLVKRYVMLVHVYLSLMLVFLSG